MIKVYEMDTYGMHDPDDNAPPYGYETAPAIHAAPALQLQTVQHTPILRSQSMPASLLTLNIEHFLDGIGD